MIATEALNHSYFFNEDDDEFLTSLTTYWSCIERLYSLCIILKQAVKIIL